jgi:hypothetical protein
VLSACCKEGSRTVSWCAEAQAIRRSTGITWHGSEIPKLTINRRYRQQTSAPGWPRAVPKVVVTSCAGIPPRQLPRRSRSGAGVHVIQPPGTPHRPLPPARSGASSPTRQDTCSRLSCPAAGRHTSCFQILVRAPRVPVPPGTHGL